MGKYRYEDYDYYSQRCFHVLLSKRAYTSLLLEVIQNSENETGGVLLGNIVDGIWYVVDSIDPGLEAIRLPTYFQWDTEYVNHLAKKLGALYKYPLTILGFWHKHPEDMDYFSETDEDAIASNLKNSKFGLLSMLVNIDPELRMTFYYCWRNIFSKVKYDVGDEYFPAELLEYVDPDSIVERMKDLEIKHISIKPNKVYSAEYFPNSLNN